jgi:hypothetical protein
MTMPLIVSRTSVLLGLAILGTAVAPASRAALGSDVASVLRDHAALGATPAVTPTVSYNVYDGRTSAGARLREYVDRSGKAFGVSYQGPQRPDISGLLGSYATRYQAAAKAHHGSHHILVINDPDLAVTIVHMARGWTLQATLPASIPAGVERAEIR